MSNKRAIEMNKIDEDTVQIMGRVQGMARKITICNRKCWQYDVTFLDAGNQTLHKNMSYSKEQSLEALKLWLEKEESRLKREE